MTSNASSGDAEETRAAGGWLTTLRASLRWVPGLLVLGLLAFVYGPLFFPESPRGLSARGEEFFFEVNEAAGAHVLVLSLWLFYRRSHYLDVLTGAGRRSVVPATVVLALTLALFGWGVYTGAPDLQLASLLGLLAGTVLLLGGWVGLRAYWLPILFLGFALPISPVLVSAVMWPAQLATAQYAGLILNAIGVEAFVQGDQILRPQNTFVVIETCSGLRTVVTLTMLTVLLIDLFERRGWRAAILIALAPIVAFLTNGARVVTLVLNPHSDVASIHNLQGIGMLLVGLTGMYLLDLGIARGLGSDEKDQAGGDLLPPSPHDRDRITNETARLFGVASVLVAMIVLGQGISPWSFPRAIDEMADDILLRAFGDWPSRELEKDAQFRGSTRFLTWARRIVAVEGGAVDVFLGVGEEQLRRHTVLTPRLAWPGSGYAVVEERRSVLGAIDAARGSAQEALSAMKTTARRLVLLRGARRVVSYSWYERAGRWPVEWLRHALALDRSLLVRPRHILAIRLSASTGAGAESLETAERRIRLVYERLNPEIRSFAPTFEEGGGRLP